MQTRKKNLVKIIDADGSIYNKKYFWILHHVVRYVSKLSTFSAFDLAELLILPTLKFTDSTLSEYTQRFKDCVNQLSEKDINELMQIIRSIGQEEYDITKQGQLVAEINAERMEYLEVHDKIYSQNKLPLYTNSFFLMIYIRHYVVNIRRHYPELLQEVLKVSNPDFISRIKDDAAQYNEVLLMSGSNRQNQEIEKIGSIQNGSDYFAHTLLDLEEIFSNLKLTEGVVRVNKLTLNDIVHKLKFSTSFENIIADIDDNKKLQIECSKFLLLYGFSHAVQSEKPNDDFMLEFSDDLVDILQGLSKIVANYPELFPKGMKFKFEFYKNSAYQNNGNYATVLEGTGAIDYNFLANVATLYRLTAMKCRQAEAIAFDAAKHLDISEFLKFRVTTNQATSLVLYSAHGLKRSRDVCDLQNPKPRKFVKMGSDHL